ncbi:t-complex protein 1 subunit eta, partial [Caerostris extrusa]
NGPIILLKEGTENSQGKQQIISNINACQGVAEAVRTTLGPRGMDKLIVDSAEVCKTTISNDGATILKELDVVHPAARTLVDIAKAQDAEATSNVRTIIIRKFSLVAKVYAGLGDGTTTVTLLAAEILKQCKPLIDDSIHPQIIIRSLRTSLKMAIAK